MTDILSTALTSILIFGGFGGDIPSDMKILRLPEGQRTQTEITVRLTGYNAVVEQTDHNPHITASGAFSNPEVIIARSRDMADTLPYGTVVELHTPAYSKNCGFDKVKQFIGYRVVADTMHKRKKRQMDVLFDVHDEIRLGERTVNPATAMGICKVTARVVGHIPINTIPKTQSELAMRINMAHLSMR